MIKIGAIIVKFSEKTSRICRDLTNNYHDSIKIPGGTTQIPHVVTRIEYVIIRMRRDLIMMRLWRTKTSQIAGKIWLILIVIQNEMLPFPAA